MSDELLSLAAAEKRLKLEGDGRGRRLRRIVETRERELGKLIMVRLRSNRRTNFRVTLGALRRYCPTLFGSKVADLEKNFRAYLDGIDDRIDERVAHHVTEHVEPRLHELWERDEVVAESVKQLAQRVERMAGVGRSPSKPAEAHLKDIE